MNEGVNEGDELTDDGGNGLLGGVEGGGGETEGKNEVPATWKSDTGRCESRAEEMPFGNTACG